MKTEGSGCSYGILFVVFVGLLFPVPVVAQDLASTIKANQWKVYNYVVAKGEWHIDKPEALPDGGLEFEFLPNNVGQSLFLLAKYHGDLTGKTITAKVQLLKEGIPKFFNRSTSCSHEQTYVRLGFQAMQPGKYEISDYWWSAAPYEFELNSLLSGSIYLSTASLSNWLNEFGQTADFNPSAFSNALKNVKQIGLVFGSSCGKASGVGIEPGNGTGYFQLLNYIVE